jgi:hypothetical protein
MQDNLKGVLLLICKLLVKHRVNYLIVVKYCQLD